MCNGDCEDCIKRHKQDQGPPSIQVTFFLALAIAGLAYYRAKVAS